nr:MAG TPA: putative sporulation protein [Caudoviricetes sp.]DAO30335.1 MAG TPA: putative sporulation protein [Caudoviricetes sp.]
MAKKNKKMLEIKEVTITINLFIFSITIKFSK